MVQMSRLFQYQRIQKNPYPSNLNFPKLRLCTSNIDNDKEDEKQLFKKRKPLNVTFNQLEEAAENDQDMNDLDYEGN